MWLVIPHQHQHTNYLFRLKIEYLRVPLYAQARKIPGNPGWFLNMSSTKYGMYFMRWEIKRNKEKWISVLEHFYYFQSFHSIWSNSYCKLNNVSLSWGVNKIIFTSRCKFTNSFHRCLIWIQASVWWTAKVNILHFRGTDSLWTTLMTRY